MNCTEMLSSLNHEDIHNRYENKLLSKKRKRESNINIRNDMILIEQSDYSNIKKMFDDMNEKINCLESRISILEEENQNKTNLINSIKSNYLTKENLKKIRIYSTIESEDPSYIN